LKEAGRRDDALRALEQALALAQQTGEVYYEAELYRLKGELQTAETDAEACFAESIKIALRQKAKSWELRTVMSVARLRAKQGKKKEGRAVLARVHNSFTEGFDTADLREARALLETLS
jgi:predicted ATPase